MADATERLNAALEGRYRIERQLGEGGMATVYLADDLRHERKVALKVLKPELAAVVGAERFLAEIKTTANLQHPHILPLFDSGEADSFLFYVMPYVEGESLRERLDREHQLPVDEAVQIAKNVAEALDYAHRQGVIHRDIKPANILLQDGKPVVSDFGIALAIGVAGGGRLTETGLSLGTPHYMSPEQATGDLGVGAASDIYAVGCVLYEMLVGDPPHVGSTAQAVLGKIVTGEADPVTKHRRSVPPNVEAAIRRALEKVPADRFAAAADFSRALGDPGFRYGEELERSGKAGLWNPLSIGLAILAALATGFGVWTLMAASSRRLPDVRFRVHPPAGVEMAPVAGLAVSADGRTVVFRAGSSGQLYYREIGEVDATPIPNTKAAWYPFFSPDGEWVGYFDNESEELWKVRLDGSEAQALASASGNAWDAAWASDHTIVGNHSTMPGLWRVRDTGGDLEPIPNTGGSALHWMSLLPGDEAVLAHHLVDGARRVIVIPLDTGERIDLFEGTTPRYVSSGHIVFWREDGLYAAPFDADRLELLGDPVRVVSNVAGSLDIGLAFFAVGGDALFYHDGGGEANQRLVLVDRTGTEEPLGFEPDLYQSPRVSPDGRRIAVPILAEAGGSGADLWVLDLDRGGKTRVTFDGDGRYYPVWVSDDQLAISDGTQDGNRINLVAADGSGRTETLLELDGRQYPTSWSFVTRMLTYTESHPESLRDVWVLPEDGEPVVVARTPAQDLAASLSPDGRWIAYVSDKSGQSEVYMRPFPETGSEFTISVGGGAEPVWSRDGSEVFYRSGTQLMSVAVGREGMFRAEAPQPLFDFSIYFWDVRGGGNPYYDVMPDGRFLMVRGGGTSGGSGVVILNFTDLLNELAPTP